MADYAETVEEMTPDYHSGQCALSSSVAISPTEQDEPPALAGATAQDYARKATPTEAWLRYSRLTAPASTPTLGNKRICRSF